MPNPLCNTLYKCNCLRSAHVTQRGFRFCRLSLTHIHTVTFLNLSFWNAHTLLYANACTRLWPISGVHGLCKEKSSEKLFGFLFLLSYFPFWAFFTVEKRTALPVMGKEMCFRFVNFHPAFFRHVHTQTQTSVRVPYSFGVHVNTLWHS